MHLTRARISFAMVLSTLCWLALPAAAQAQYNCAVAIERDGKAILAGRIRDVQRPSTDQLWELLKTLSFSPARDARNVPDAAAAAQATLRGDLCVEIDGAGQVRVKELRLVRNQYNPSAWVIAPEDVTRILEQRQAPGDEKSKK